MRIHAAMLAMAAVALGSSYAKPAKDDAHTVHAGRGVALAPKITSADLECSAYRTAPYVRAESKYGIACLGTIPPGSTASPRPPRQNYLVADLHKPGFPHLTPDESLVLARIRRYEKAATLRIAWVESSNRFSDTQCIVFDAYDGPCEVWASGYPVLNGACNENFQPGENPYHTIPIPDCLGTPRPWDKGSP